MQYLHKPCYTILSIKSDIYKPYAIQERIKTTFKYTLLMKMCVGLFKNKLEGFVSPIKHLD